MWYVRCVFICYGTLVFAVKFLRHLGRISFVVRQEKAAQYTDRRVFFRSRTFPPPTESVRAV